MYVCIIYESFLSRFILDRGGIPNISPRPFYQNYLVLTNSPDIVYTFLVKHFNARWFHVSAIAEVRCWSVVGWVTKNLLSPAPLCFGRLVKP
jgi:hypothetical protein